MRILHAHTWGVRGSLEGANLFLNVIGLVVDVISDDSHGLGKDGSVTTTYDAYSSYGYDEKQGKYIGIDKTGTFKSVKVNSIEEAYQYLKS